MSLSEDLLKKQVEQTKKTVDALHDLLIGALFILGSEMGCRYTRYGLEINPDNPGIILDIFNALRPTGLLSIRATEKDLRDDQGRLVLDTQGNPAKTVDKYYVVAAPPQKKGTS